MANRKDMRRSDLIVPYSEPAKDGKDSQDMATTMSTTLPMAAIFTRNKMIGWTAVIFALQGWLSETPAQAATASQPAYFGVGMAMLSLGVAYMPLFLPPAPGAKLGAGTGTGVPAPVPSGA